MTTFVILSNQTKAIWFFVLSSRESYALSHDCSQNIEKALGVKLYLVNGKTRDDSYQGKLVLVSFVVIQYARGISA